MMDVPGEGPRWATVRRHVEYLDGTKMGMYHWNSLMYTKKYEL